MDIRSFDELAKEGEKLPELDKVTITISGNPKTGKSNILLYLVKQLDALGFTVSKYQDVNNEDYGTGIGSIKDELSDNNLRALVELRDKVEIKFREVRRNGWVG